VSLFLLAARLLLAAVFLAAGVAKLADLRGSRQAMRDFGVPARLAAPLGVLLPLAEIMVAVALLLPRLAWWGSLGALLLLLLFVGGISFNLAQGRQPDCHCFGQLHSAPAGRLTLIRNLALAGIAIVILASSNTATELGILDWLGPLSVGQTVALVGGVLLFALVLGEGWLILQIMSQQGRLLLRIEAFEAAGAQAGTGPMPQPAPGGAGLPVGSAAPNFTLQTLAGESTTLQALRTAGKPVVLLFADPGCGPCNAMLPEIGRWQQEFASRLVVAVVSRGTIAANHPKASEHGLTHILLQRDREVAQAYAVNGTPSAVLIGQDGTVGSTLAQGADAIRALVHRALPLGGLKVLPMADAYRNGNGTASASRPAAIAVIGKPAPEFRLPDLGGQVVSLSDFRGDRTLVLFWRPSCGFCQRMLTDLHAWETHPPAGAPRLLVVSTDSVESNQAMGLRSPVLLDQDGMRVGSLFGATGTPMAVLVDANGNIASEVAAGAPAVLALAGQEQDTAAHA
jgi:peroxiredoxin